jgi:hypothetical protein
MRTKGNEMFVSMSFNFEILDNLYSTQQKMNPEKKNKTLYGSISITLKLKQTFDKEKNIYFFKNKTKISLFFFDFFIFM